MVNRKPPRGGGFLSIKMQRERIEWEMEKKGEREEGREKESERERA